MVFRNSLRTMRKGITPSLTLQVKLPVNFKLLSSHKIANMGSDHVLALSQQDCIRVTYAKVVSPY